MLQHFLNSRKLLFVKKLALKCETVYFIRTTTFYNIPAVPSQSYKNRHNSSITAQINKCEQILNKSQPWESRCLRNSWWTEAPASLCTATGGIPSPLASPRPLRTAARPGTCRQLWPVARCTWKNMLIMYFHLQSILYSVSRVNLV